VTSSALIAVLGTYVGTSFSCPARADDTQPWATGGRPSFADGLLSPTPEAAHFLDPAISTISTPEN
jgi:hypothetical protein